jgi:hypothetical protein
MKTVLLLPACLAIAGCSTYAVPRYAVSVDNVTALRTLNGQKINVGEFAPAKRQEDVTEITCRAVGPIKTPDGEPFSQYIRKAFVSELKMADVYGDGAPVTLTGTLDHVDFSSTSGAWQIGLTVSSSNGKSMHVEESYEFSSSFFGETACNQTAQAFMAGVQDLLGKLVRDPAFKPLVGAVDSSQTADKSTAGSKRVH